jgi:hypothetical protein
MKYQISFILIAGLYFCLNGFLPRKTEVEKYSLELQNDGWKKHAADHIAKVELKKIPMDSIYINYKND